MTRLHVFAALAALGAALVVPAMLSSPLHAQDDDDDNRSRIDTTLSIVRDGTVDLSLISGEIRVSSWNRDQVHVRATSERGILRLDATPSRVTVTVRADHGDMGDTQYEVTVPATVHVLTRSVSGDITVHGAGDLDANSVSGDIVTADVTGRVALESVSGGVTATHVGRGLRAHSVSGDVRVSDVTGDVDAQTVSGDIALRDIRSSYVRSETVSGETRFSGTLDPNGRYDFHAHSGDIILTIPKVGATFDVQTFSGDIDSDYPMTVGPGEEAGGRHVRFSINGGGARVGAESFSGDITIQSAGQSGREN